MAEQQVRFAPPAKRLEQLARAEKLLAEPSLTLLLIGRIISGITAATISTSFAYIADVTTPDERAKSFGIVGVAFGAGFVMGPALGGLLGGFDPRLPFWVAAAASLLNAAFGWFVLDRHY